MVLKLQTNDWNVEQILIDSGSYVDILYWDAFKGMNMDPCDFLAFKGTLVGFSSEHV